MRYSETILSDNKPITVRRLALFELADLDSQLPAPFRFSILTVTGDVIEQEFDFSHFPEPPQPPDDPDPAEGSPDWYKLKEFNLYQAALLHEQTRHEAYHALNKQIALYILHNCLDPDDLPRVVEPADYTAVYHAAIVPQLTMEALADELAAFFQSNLQWLTPVRLPISGHITEIPQPGPGGDAEAMGV